PTAEIKRPPGDHFDPAAETKRPPGDHFDPAAQTPTKTCGNFTATAQAQSSPQPATTAQTAAETKELNQDGKQSALRNSWARDASRSLGFNSQPIRPCRCPGWI
ncbi:MAG: hypothetical protein COB96_00925, partial [Planctomycetota bacterium]